MTWGVDRDVVQICGDGIRKTKVKLEQGLGKGCEEYQEWTLLVHKSNKKGQVQCTPPQMQEG